MRMRPAASAGAQSLPWQLLAPVSPGGTAPGSVQPCSPRADTLTRPGRAAGDGQPGIQHGSRVKVRLQHPDGWHVDRIPAWIRWSVVEPNKMGAHYDGVAWYPPKDQRHQWCALHVPTPGC